MPKILDVLSNSITNDIQKLSNVSNNVANVNTTGFKSISLVEKTQNSSFDAPTLIQKIDFTNGNLTKTERPYDFAIQGNGFFVAESSNGELYLTRNGSFKLNSEGILTTSSGMTVLGESGPIEILESNITIDSSGSLFSNGRQINQLTIVEPDNLDSLSYKGSGLYSLGLGNDMSSNNTSSVLRGHLESSNISSSQQMIELIQLSRHMQSTQKAVQSYTNILDSGINKIGSQ